MLGRMFGSLSLVSSFATTALVLAAQIAPPSEVVDAPSIAQAYGEVSVFVLNVAAGLDGHPRDAAAEQAVANTFAQQMFEAYPTLDAETQANFAQLPQLRTALRQVWPTMTPEQRTEVRDQWAAGVQASLPSLPCAAFDTLARAYLLPAYGSYKEVNGDRLVQCWNEHPELARSRDGRDLAAERARMQQSAGGDHATYVGLMNAETTRYAGTMNMISIMSGDPYRWSVK
jgi:hypothetical protein